jgi:DUF971 family protein
MAIQPTKLALAGRILWIEWSDRTRRQYDAAELRRNCPCATCQAERARPVDGQAPDAAPGLMIRQVNPVGHYAYNIHFSDGHDTGIYPLELLRRLGQERAPS